MTVALCVLCGSIKHGAFNHCGVCGKRPETEIDLAYSLALTDHYFAVDTLNEISADMLRGRPRPSLPAEQEKKFLEAAQAHIERFGNALGLPASPHASAPQDVKGIRIHPSGQGRSTDMTLAHRLEQTTPRSYRKAQDVLVAAKKYVDGPGLFRSRKSLIQNLQKEVYALEDELEKEGYEAGSKSSPVEMLFSYLSEFSDAYPNWQREYSALNKFVPMCF